MKLTVFSNSTGNCAFQQCGGTLINSSYIDMLYEKFQNINGYTKDGMMIFHAKTNLLNLLSGRDNKIIIHLGINEAVTSPAINFLVLATYHYNCWDLGPEYKTFVAPKMFAAANDIQKGVNNYYRFLEPFEFRFMWECFGQMLYGSKPIIMGFSKPNSICKDYVFEQTYQYDEILKEVCMKFDMVHVDVWNICNSDCIDGNHLTQAGHKKLFDYLMGVL